MSNQHNPGTQSELELEKLRHNVRTAQDAIGIAMMNIHDPNTKARQALQRAYSELEEARKRLG